MQATATAPATLSNLGPGFDVLGLALDRPREVIRAELDDSGEITIVPGGPYGGRIPLEPAQNVAAYAAARVLAARGSSRGVRLTIEKHVPPGSGLGSSAASSVAAALATTRALGFEPVHEELLPIVRDAEGLASGSPHLDNVSPALFGGFVAVVGVDPPRVRKLPFPSEWRFAIVLPEMVVRTADARAVLPREIPRESAIANLRDLAGLFDAITRTDLEAFAAHLSDHIAAPYRLHLWPHLAPARAAGLAAGAKAVEISGSGPALFAPCPNDQVAQKVCDAIRIALAARQLESTAWVASCAR